MKMFELNEELVCSGGDTASGAGMRDALTSQPGRLPESLERRRGRSEELRNAAQYRARPQGDTARVCHSRETPTHTFVFLIRSDL